MTNEEKNSVLDKFEEKELSKKEMYSVKGGTTATGEAEEEKSDNTETLTSPITFGSKLKKVPI
jgi:natural product precursor